MCNRKYDDAVGSRVINQQVRKPAEPITAGAVEIGRPAIRMGYDLSLSVVKFGKEGFRGPRIPFGIPAPCFPRFQERFGMKLKRRVVHLRRSFSGLESRGPS